MNPPASLQCATTGALHHDENPEQHAPAVGLVVLMPSLTEN
jgi:hypothetical protein